MKDKRMLNRRFHYWGTVLAAVLLVCTALAESDPNSFDPANAAHWYRKAFALYAEPNEIDLDGYIHGKIELTPEIRQFLELQQPIIDLITKATQIERCDWEYADLYEFNTLGHFLDPEYLLKSKKVAHLLSAIIKLNLSRKNFDSAIELCDLFLNMAKDIDQYSSTKSYAVSMALRAYGYSQVHKTMDDSVEYPKYLIAIKKLLDKEKTYNYSTYNDTLTYKIKIIENYCKKEYFQDDKIWGFMADVLPFKDFEDDFFDRNRNYYIQHIRQIQRLSSQPYSDSLKAIDELNDNLSQKTEEYIEILNHLPDNQELSPENSRYLQKCDYLIAGLFSTNPQFSISIENRVNNQFNALRTAVVLQQIRHETRNLPDKTPATCPKDLFSDKPFLIIRTTDGFTLKCQGEDLSCNTVHEYEFKLPAG